ncbi:MAG TPA: hypothetical protein VHO70_11160 [Chitinispirillaceae bacterium]|nr:hypothetical protein [Chitinispirillaceae bacterium]
MKLQSLRSDYGFATMYGIIILFVASIAGVSLITISQKDNISSIDQVKMRTASVSAEAALRAVEQQCENQPQTIIDIVNKFVKLGSSTTNKGWLLSNATDWDRENRISLDSTVANAPQYSARVLSFNTDNLIMQVEGYGYGGTSGRKKAIGLYQLSGVEAALPYKKYAIDIRCEAQYFDRPINVLGNVCFSDALQFNGGASGSIIDGTFEAVSPTAQVTFAGSVTFKNKALFMGPVTGNVPFTLMSNAGFNSSVHVDGIADARNDVYFNNTINGNRYFNMNGHTAHHGATYINPARISNGSLVQDGSSIDVASVLSLSSALPPSLQFDISSIPAAKILRSSVVFGSQVDATKINNLYTSSSSLWNDYLVIKVDNSLQMNRNWGSNLVNHKTLWIIESAMTTPSGWYDCGTGTMTVIYLRSHGSVNDLGTSGYFRGYIHASDNTNVIYNWRTGNNFIGAIHHSSHDAGFQMNTGSTWNITLDESVLEELITLGLLRIPGANTSIKQLVLSDLKIRPRVIGKYF